MKNRFVALVAIFTLTSASVAEARLLEGLFAQVAATRLARQGCTPDEIDQMAAQLKNARAKELLLKSMIARQNSCHGPETTEALKKTATIRKNTAIEFAKQERILAEKESLVNAHKTIKDILLADKNIIQVGQSIIDAQAQLHEKSSQLNTMKYRYFMDRK